MINVTYSTERKAFANTYDTLENKYVKYKTAPKFFSSCYSSD